MEEKALAHVEYDAIKTKALVAVASIFIVKEYCNETTIASFNFQQHVIAANRAESSRVIQFPQDTFATCFPPILTFSGIEERHRGVRSKEEETKG